MTAQAREWTGLMLETLLVDGKLVAGVVRIEGGLLHVSDLEEDGVSRIRLYL